MTEPEPHFQPLAVRLSRTVLAWSLLASLALSAVVGGWEHREVLTQQKAALRKQGEALARALPEAVWAVSPDLFGPHLDGAASWPGVAYVAVLERNGYGIMAESGLTALRDRPADIELPIVLERKAALLGSLKIVIDQAAIDEHAMQAGLKSMAASLALLALVLGIVLATLRRQLQAPLQQLAAFLQRLRTEQLDEKLVLHRPARPGRDEIDLVVDAIATLQGRIALHVRELDARVAERTEQLQTALDTLKTLAVTDPLTGCHNRLAFSQKYPEAVAHAERYERPLSVVFCDVDRFKAVNDGHGHPAGDRVIAAVGQWLRGALRGSSDWVARYGGEEFVLVLPETPLAQALEVAERLRLQIAQSEGVALDGGQRLHITVSLGVAQWRPGESGEALLQRADEQLYAAKQAGRNQVQPPVQVMA